MISYVVVGASRGIGLELVRQLAADENNIIYAVVRNIASSTHLSTLVASIPRSSGRVHVVEGDVVDHRAMRAAANRVAALSAGSGVDVLIHNAARMDSKDLYRGFHDYESDDALDADFMESFKVNVLGVIHTVNAFLPLLRAGTARKIIVVSTGGGERDIVWRTRLGDMGAYGVSKAGTNMVATKYAVQLEQEGFTVVATSPGLVDVSATATRELDEFSATKLAKIVDGIKNALPDYKALMPQESVQSLLNVVAEVGPADTGTFKR
ncbi:NAD(P)-binding protein [Wolfiporia cocos MD-104 SS10]|uniref:NAD(P)-binding protein n=1 Tax=Wolfiporia cocos (strain MD-104) TaxID=742152 RepID=A0A2H3JM11_WOLCO|nr:NAD(P)-binding protein [Wolfiporia cocos MD-104 SS10]